MPSSNEPPQQPPKQQQQQEAPPNTTLAMGIALLVLGTSAGFTLYTKKANGMLRTMEQITENQARRNPPKFGPQTKAQYETYKPRIDKDEFY